jgi:hypothetical protein
VSIVVRAPEAFLGNLMIAQHPRLVAKFGSNGNVFVDCFKAIMCVGGTKHAVVVLAGSVLEADGKWRIASSGNKQLASWQPYEI